MRGSASKKSKGSHDSLAEFPSIVAYGALVKSRHGLIRRARLHLIERALALLALAALELVRRANRRRGALGVEGGLGLDVLVLLLPLVARELKA